MSQYDSPEMKRVIDEFSGDYRVMRVVLSSSDPISTLHKIRNGHYSIHTFLDMLEMLDVKSTMEELEIMRAKAKSNNKP